MKITCCILFVFCNIIITLAQGKFFIIGGGKRSEEMVKRIIKEAGVNKKKYIAIIPFASEDQDSAIYFASQQFFRAGINNIIGINHHKGQAISKSTLDSISSATLIYITGGDQNRLMDIIKNSPVEAAIKNCFLKGNMIVSTSAGAAAMSEKMITGIELNYTGTTESTEKEGFQTIEANNIEIKQGLGFLKNCIIDQHFVKRKRINRLLSVAIEHPFYYCIGIDEATAILIKNNRAEVIGNSQVLVITNRNRNLKNYNNKLGGKNLKLDIYLTGDTFSIK